jgi:YegS/Rv2252/BmrU family lipid kinase
MPQFRRLKIVINPASGRTEPVLSTLNDVLGSVDIEWDVAITHGAGDGSAAAREAVEQGWDLIGVYGGDGTVAEVASALAGTDTPLLVLPGGTGNALAEDLGIPPGLADASALLGSGEYRVRSIDVGRVGQLPFVLRLTMGFEAEMVVAATREMKDRYGWLAYALTGLQTLSAPPVATYSMTIDGVDVVSEGVAAVVANSASTGVAGVKFAEDVDLSDGILDVVVVHQAGLFGWLASAADAAQGQQPRMMSRWRGRVIRIEARPAQSVLADGEDAGVTPIDVTVEPGALQVIVPRAIEGAD